MPYHVQKAGAYVFVYDNKTDGATLEIGQGVAAQIHELAKDPRCASSIEECIPLASGLLEQVAQNSSYFERGVVNGKLETRQVLLLGILGLAAWSVLYTAYSANSVATLPNSHVAVDLKIDSTVGQPEDQHLPVTTNISAEEFDPESYNTISTDEAGPRERFIMIEASIAGNREKCTSLIVAVAAIASAPPGNHLSPYDIAPLPGWLTVDVTKDKDDKIKALSGVKAVIGGPTLVDDANTASAPTTRDPLPMFKEEDAGQYSSAPLNLTKRGSREVGALSTCHRFASWAPGMQQAPDRYLFQDAEGADYPMYLIDKGFELLHPEFDDLRNHYPLLLLIGSDEIIAPGIKWFLADGIPDDFANINLNSPDPSLNVHGTTM